MIKAVIFDIDGVLVDSLSSNWKFFCDLFKYTGHKQPSLEEYKNCFHLSMDAAIRAMLPGISEDEVNRIWEIGANRDIGYDEELKMTEGASDVIIELSRDYDLAIVTSRIGTGVFESKELALLSSYFKEVISYHDTEKHKPHPDPLLLAADRLGYQPNECVYIGDLESDVIAARAAGTKIITFSTESFHDADAGTASFIDIPNLINNLKA